MDLGNGRNAPCGAGGGAKAAHISWPQRMRGRRLWEGEAMRQVRRERRKQMSVTPMRPWMKADGGGQRESDAGSSMENNPLPAAAGPGERKKEAARQLANSSGDAIPRVSGCLLHVRLFRG
jgi:hypothetical protein